MSDTGRVDLGIEGFEDAVLIGQGGFGSVYRARQIALDRTVAVKVLSIPGLEDDTKKRFERECRAVGALSGHPHIVTVHDCGFNRWDRPYIVMDHMARGSLGDVIARGPMEWPDASAIGVKLAGAVATAHAAGVLHRDIKPENALLSSYGEPKLADFGISSLANEHQTNSGAITASLSHAAPELLEGSPSSVVSDLYALGSTIFSLVAGHPPFPRGDEEPLPSLVTRIVTAPVPDLRPRGIPDRVCAVLERALDKDPAARFASAAELGDALRDAEQEQGIVPTPMVVDPELARVTADRFTALQPREGTSRTRSRIRPVLVPPTPEEPAPNDLRKRLLIGAAVVAVLASAATAFAVTRPEDPAPAAAPGPSPEETVANEPRDAAREREGRNRRPRVKKKRNGGNAGAGSSGFVGGSFSGSGGSGGGGSFGGSPSGSSGGSGGGSSGGSGGGSREPAKEQPPPAPPPPGHTLYHLKNSKTGEHYVTIIAARAHNLDDQENWEMVQVGKAYSEQVKGTIAIGLDDGTAWIFSSATPNTSPRTSTAKLYKVTHPNGDLFYTTSSSEAGRATGEGWHTYTTAGYIGSL